MLFDTNSYIIPSIMHQQLPREIDPFRFAHSGLQITGEIPVSKMSRLSEMLYDDSGTVLVDMQFDIDTTGTPFMLGQFAVTVNLLCERCMESMAHSMNITTKLALVRHEGKVEGLAEQYEPWILNDAKQVDPALMVEDELILALPIVPKHDYSCLPEQLWQAGEEEIEPEKPVSPFAALSALKSKK
ncbi:MULTISPECIES: YceD family protein [Methylophaga]|nr:MULTISPECIES: YceD family protein [Methylophaga]THK41256.1 DNA-binding protein [Methylophaga sp. SB9B]